MNSHNQPDDLLDIRLQHTLINWVARKEAPLKSRDQLLIAARQQNLRPKPGDFIKRNLGWLFASETYLNGRSVFPGYGHALDAVYAIKASMTIA